MFRSEFDSLVDSFDGFIIFSLSNESIGFDAPGFGIVGIDLGSLVESLNSLIILTLTVERTTF